MKEIELSQGLVALVDDGDYERVAQFKWSAARYRKTFYAVRKIYHPQSKTIYLHRFILDAPDGVEVDHKSRNGLDCQRDNLRYSTHAQNMYNQGLYSTNTSGLKGVSWNKRKRKWCAYIQIGGKSRRTLILGFFSDKEEAGRARDDASRKYHGEFAYLNFPNDDVLK